MNVLNAMTLYTNVIIAKSILVLMNFYPAVTTINTFANNAMRTSGLKLSTQRNPNPLCDYREKTKGEAMENSWLFKVVPIFIGFVFVLIIVIFITVGVIGFKAVNAVDQKGLKTVISDIWNGTGNSI